MKKGRTKPQCHPDRKHYAKGLCGACYDAQLKKKKKKQKEPVRVIHTHEVIRQVQQEKNKMAEKHATHHGSTEEEGEVFERPADASKDAVVSEAGVTEPSEALGGDGVTPLAEFTKKYREQKKKQAVVDAKRRKEALEEAAASNMMTTAKGV